MDEENKVVEMETQEPDAEQQEAASVSVAEMQRRIKKEKEKYEKMLADQKSEHEREKLKSKLSKDEREAAEQKEKDDEIQRLKAQLLRNEMTNKAAKALSESGFAIDDVIMDYFVREDEESTLEAVRTFTKLINEKVSERLKESARQEPPTKGGTGGGAGSFNVADFARQKRIIKG